MLRVKINGEIWKIRNLGASTFDSKYGSGLLGICVYHHPKKLREIHFRGSRPSFNTITHEIGHAYLSYRDCSKMSYGRIEETFCEFLGSKLQVVNRVAKRIQKGLK